MVSKNGGKKKNFFFLLIMATKLSPKTQQICLEIMDILMQKPSASVFLSPVDPEKDNVPDYYQVIKHPIDLGTIHKRLQNGEYSNKSQWDKEMNLVWTNAEKYYKKGSLISILANELHRVYDKECEKLKLLRTAKWSRVIVDLNQKLDRLYEQPPAVVNALLQLKERKDEEKLKPFSEEELNILIHMSQYLANNHDSMKILRIIKYFQPDTVIANNNLFKLDVNDLELKTLYALRDYITYRLAEMNIQYPR